MDARRVPSVFHRMDSLSVDPIRPSRLKHMSNTPDDEPGLGVARQWDMHPADPIWRLTVGMGLDRLQRHNRREEDRIGPTAGEMHHLAGNYWLQITPKPMPSEVADHGRAHRYVETTVLLRPFFERNGQNPLGKFPVIDRTKLFDCACEPSGYSQKCTVATTVEA